MIRLGFIGLGAMGRGICDNLIQKSACGMTVFDVDANAAEPFAGRANVAKQADEVFSQSDVIFLSLPNSDVVEQTVEALLSLDAKGKTVVDLSTSYPLSTVALHDKLKARGAALVDAPLLGGPDDTARGSAPCMIAGDKEDVDRVMPFIRCYADPIDFVGKIGNAHTVKLAMNFTGLSYAVIAAQMFALMEKLGIDTKELFQVMNREIFGNWVFDFYGRKFVNRDYHMDFALELGLKDLSYVKRLYDAFHVPAFALDGILNLLCTSLKEGRGKRDYSEVAATLYEYFGV